MYLDHLQSGERVRAKKESILASTQDSFQFGNGRTGLSFKPRRIRVGEEFIFRRLQTGAGADPAYDVILTDVAGNSVIVSVGWFHLRDSDWEVLREDGP